MLSSFTQFGSSSGLGALGLSLSSFLIQLITFVIAILILKRFAFKPIMKILKERQETIERGVKLGEQMVQEKKVLDDKVEAELHKARTRADEIIAEAEQTAKVTIQDAESKAREKAELIVKSAEEQIAQETSQARQKLEKDIAELVAEATEALLKEKVDIKKDSELIDRVLKEQRA